MRVTQMVVVLLAAGFVAPAVHGQIAVPGAEKDTLSLLTTGGSVDFEFTQGKIGLSILRELTCGGRAGAELEACKVCLSEFPADFGRGCGHGRCRMGHPVPQGS